MTIPHNALSPASTKLLQTVFGDLWPEAWVCWTGNMKGKRVKRLVEGDLPETEDCYFCIALLKPGATGRTLDNAKRVYAIVIDDVGTKIPLDAMMLAPKPTWIIETSPGNFHYGYAISDGMDVKTYQQLRHAMNFNTVWGKSDGIDAVHLFRLPQGVNTKHGGSVS